MSLCNLPKVTYEDALRLVNEHSRVETSKLRVICILGEIHFSTQWQVSTQQGVEIKQSAKYVAEGLPRGGVLYG